MTCPRQWTLDIGSLRIRRGRCTAILGHSGSGKSTLLNLLGLLDTPDSDTTTFEIRARWPGPANVVRPLTWTAGQWLQNDGSSLKSDTVRSLLFGYVFQAGHLTSNLTVAQNASLGMALRGDHPNLISTKSAALLSLLGLSHRTRSLPRHLSGGEYQRAAIARALAHDPEIVLADEPTGNLDPTLGQSAMNALRNWQIAGDKTLILVTHNIDFALNYSDYVNVLYGGRSICHRRTSRATAAQLLAAIGGTPC